jgi:hypothetical protein
MLVAYERLKREEGSNLRPIASPEFFPSGQRQSDLCRPMRTAQAFDGMSYIRSWREACSQVPLQRQKGSGGLVTTSALDQALGSNVQLIEISHGVRILEHLRNLQAS